MTTDITELALITIKNQIKSFDTVVLRENEALALVESLEKAQHKADVYDMLRNDYGLREKGVGLTDFVDWQAKRIAELEESHAQVIQSRDHYKRISEEGLKQLAESRTVKLPPKVDSSNIPFAGHTWNCCLDEVEKRLAAAGIKVEAE